MIIGIGGVSNSGKSVLARRIEKLVHPKKACVLCQDDFTKPRLPYIKDHLNWEHPDSIDFEKLHQRVLLEEKSHDVVILEGIFAFHHAPTTQLFDKAIYLTIDRDTFFDRKKRDMRWGKEPAWYIEHIWNSHLTYGAKTAHIANILQLFALEPITDGEIISYVNL